jgi:hypothetical protein
MMLPVAAAAPMPSAPPAAADSPCAAECGPVCDEAEPADEGAPDHTLRHLFKKKCDKTDCNPVPSQEDPLNWNRCLGQRGSAACNGMDLSAPPPPHCGHLVGGASVYLLQPYFGDNLAFTRTRLSTTTTTTGTGATNSTATGNSRTTTDFTYDYTVSPAVWFGVVNDCGFGLQGRFFRFDQFANLLGADLSSAAASGTGSFMPPPNTTAVISFAAPASITSLLPGVAAAGTAPSPVSAADTSGTGGDHLDFRSRLLIEQFDVDATYDAQLGHLGLQLACGGRYVHMAQDFAEALIGTGVPLGGKASATETESLQFGHNFSGAGPALGLQARWQFGDSALAVVGSARGALLIGRSRETAQFFDQVHDPNGILAPPGGSTLSSNFSRDKDTVLPVAEVEVGLEYAPPCCSCRPFLRVAAINQTYFDAGSASSFDGNLGLFGVDFTLGVDY